MPMVRRIAGMFRRKLTTSVGKESHDPSDSRWRQQDCPGEPTSPTMLQIATRLAAGASQSAEPRMRRQRAVLKLSKRSSP